MTIKVTEIDGVNNFDRRNVSSGAGDKRNDVKYKTV